MGDHYNDGCNEDEEWDNESIEDYENIDDMDISKPRNTPPELPPPLFQRKPLQNQTTPITGSSNQNSPPQGSLSSRSTVKPQMPPASLDEVADEVYEAPDVQPISWRETVNRPLPIPPRDPVTIRNNTTPSFLPGSKENTLSHPFISNSKGYQSTPTQIQTPPKARLPQHLTVTTAPQATTTDLPSSAPHRFQSQLSSTPCLPPRMKPSGRTVPLPPGADSSRQRRPSEPEISRNQMDEEYLAPEDIMAEAQAPGINCVRRMVDRRPSLPSVPSGKQPIKEFATTPNEPPRKNLRKPLPPAPDFTSAVRSPPPRVNLPSLPAPADDIYEALDDETDGVHTNTHRNEAGATHLLKQLAGRDSTDSCKPGIVVGQNTIAICKQKLRPVMSIPDRNKSPQSSATNETASNDFKKIIDPPSPAPFRVTGNQSFDTNEKQPKSWKTPTKPYSPPSSPFSEIRKVPLVPARTTGNRTSDGSTDNRSSASSTMSTDSIPEAVPNGFHARGSPQGIEIHNNRGIPQTLPKSDPLEKHNWYFGVIERKVADEKVSQLIEDGSFLIRKSGQSDPEHIYTLCILCQKEVFNIPVRKRNVDGKFAVGAAGKMNEQIFNSVEEIVSYHGNNGLDVLKKEKHYGKITFKGSPKKK